MEENKSLELREALEEMTSAEQAPDELTTVEPAELSETPSEAQDKRPKKGEKVLGVLSLAAGAVSLLSPVALPIVYFVMLLVDTLVIGTIETFIKFDVHFDTMPSFSDIFDVQGGASGILFGANPVADCVMFALAAVFAVCAVVSLVCAYMSRSKETGELPKTAKIGRILALLGMAGCLVAVAIPVFRNAVNVLISMVNVLRAFFASL